MSDTITARFIIQIAGKPVENVEKALNIVLEKVKENKENYKVIESEIIEPELDEESTLYSGFIEASAKFADVNKLLNFIYDFTPNSVEIEDPEKLKFSANEMTGILNDMSNFMLKVQSEKRNLQAQAYLLDKKVKELQGKK